MRPLLGLLLAGLLSGSLAASLPSQALLNGGCCPGAVWAPDSRALLFLDGPPARPPASTRYRPAAAR